MGANKNYSNEHPQYIFSRRTEKIIFQFYIINIQANFDMSNLLISKTPLVSK